MATRLGDMAVGSTVKLNFNGEATDFIIVHQGNPSPSLYDESCTGTWLLMKDCYVIRAWHKSNVNDYEKSDIHAYLRNTFLYLFDSNIQNAIQRVKIPYRPGSGVSRNVNIGANGLSCKIFLLSGYEVGWNNTDEQYFLEEGAKLDYFWAGTSKGADNKRIANMKNGSAVGWWLRSPCPLYDSGAFSVDSLGNYGERECPRDSGVRPALIVPSSLLVSDDGSVSTNTAPTTPTTITVPESIQGGTTIALSWSASTDAEDNLAGYYVEKSVNGGSVWSQIYQGTLTNTTDNVAFGTASVMYRVKAYDTEGLESGWLASGAVTVINNRAPTAPGSITVPMTVSGGQDLTVTWTEAVDSDGNLAGYELERQNDGGEWSNIYKGGARSFTDRIEKGWSSVAYRVRAYDNQEAAGAWTTSDTRTVINNTPPAVTCDSGSGTDLGTKAEGFTVQYSVDDEDGDSVTVTEAVDGVQVRQYAATLKQSETFDVTGLTFQKVLNGKRELTVTASDGKASTVHRLIFTKEVTAASITLAEPMEADGEITLAILAVAGSIPAGANYKVEVTNNGKDAEPTWQDATAEVKGGSNIVFTNHSKTGGKWAFNFKVSVSRGESGQGGYITSVQGGFQ